MLRAPLAVATRAAIPTPLPRRLRCVRPALAAALLSSLALSGPSPAATPAAPTAAAPSSAVVSVTGSGGGAIASQLRCGRRSSKRPERPRRSTPARLPRTRVCAHDPCLTDPGARSVLDRPGSGSTGGANQAAAGTVTHSGRPRGDACTCASPCMARRQRHHRLGVGARCGAGGLRLVQLDQLDRWRVAVRRGVRFWGPGS
eukprot:362968-Chlamydomonas_euryale.AAC.2